MSKKWRTKIVRPNFKRRKFNQRNKSKTYISPFQSNFNTTLKRKNIPYYNNIETLPLEHAENEAPGYTPDIITKIVDKVRSSEYAGRDIDYITFETHGHQYFSKPFFDKLNKFINEEKYLNYFLIVVSDIDRDQLMRMLSSFGYEENDIADKIWYITRTSVKHEEEHRLQKKNALKYTEFEGQYYHRVENKNFIRRQRSHSKKLIVPAFSDNIKVDGGSWRSLNEELESVKMLAK